MGDIWLGESGQNGTVFDGGIARAGAHESAHGITKVSKLTKPLVNRRELLLGSLAHGTAWCALPGAEREELLGLGQREAKSNGMPDEAKAVHGVVGVAPVAALGSARRRQETNALVVAHRLDSDLGTPRQGANGKGPVVHAGSMGAVATIGSRTHAARALCYPSGVRFLRELAC